MERFSLQLNKKQIWLYLTVIMVLGLLLRLLLGYYFVHYFDVDYYVDWSMSAVNDGLFRAYQNLGDRLDYPPVFLFFLIPTGLMLNNSVIFDFENYKMLALKMPQIVFDIATILLIYLVLHKQNKILALLAAGVWAMNPTIIFNCAVWGQTDSLMIFFLLLAFYLLEQEKPIAATVIYAVAGLTKFQSLYFAPVFLLFLFYKRNVKKSLTAFGAGIGTGILIFLPFMIYSGITLPFEVYLGGLGKYQYVSLNAFNFYAALGLNNVHDATKLFGVLPLGAITTIMTVLVLVLIVVMFFTATNRCPWLFGFLMMQGLFMFGGRMHERYQIPVLIFLLIAAARHRSGKLFAGFAALTGMTFLNHFFLFEYMCSFQKAAWAPYYDEITVILSIVNLLLFVLTFCFSWTILYGKCNTIQNIETVPTEEPANV